MQTKTLQVIDQVVTWRDGGEEIVYFGGTMISRLIKPIGHVLAG
jgi:hypothetical protein